MGLLNRGPNIEGGIIRVFTVVSAFVEQDT